MSIRVSKPSQTETRCDPTLAAMRVSIAATLVALCLTGVLLMTAYNPSTVTAWGSVCYIQTQMTVGWLIRGVHFFASEAILVLSLLYIAAVVAKHAYRGAGGGVWLMSLGVAAVALSASLTGHLLPWDQDGYWGTVVRTNILARTPLVGDSLRQLLLGGSSPGNLTLARCHMLHVVLLPLLLSPVLSWLPIFHRRIVAEAKRDAVTSVRAWPVARLTLSLIGLSVVAIHYAADWTFLSAPADATAANYPARPEWHTLFLFQWLKFFEGPSAEVVASIFLPALVLGALLLLPLSDVLMRGNGRRVAVSFTALLLAGAGVLTVYAMLADREPSKAELKRALGKQSEGGALDAGDQDALRSAQFHQQRRNAIADAKRAIELANEHGIPPTGPLALLANDPQTQGPRLFSQDCAACHRFNGHNGAGTIPGEPATSSDLRGFASRRWIRRLLDDPAHNDYFGLMKKSDGEPAHTRMARWVKTFRAENAGDVEAADAKLDAVAAYLENESILPGRLAEIDAYSELTDDPSTGDERVLRQGRLFFARTCNECHTYNGENEGTTRAPELLGYGSVEWLIRMIAEPDHETRYRKTGKEPTQMPRFAEKLTENEIALIARWIHESRQIGP